MRLLFCCFAYRHYSMVPSVNKGTHVPLSTEGKACLRDIFVKYQSPATSKTAARITGKLCSSRVFSYPLAAMARRFSS